MVLKNKMKAMRTRSGRGVQGGLKVRERLERESRYQLAYWLWCKSALYVILWL